MTIQPSSELGARIASSPELPGVYRFIGDADGVLYVGKAKNLRKRLQSYLRTNLATKTAALMALARDLDITVTNNETEALLLEQTLIKQHRPKFNVLLRDDKSYPYLHLSAHRDFPYLMVRRGNQAKSGKLFGPYSSGFALRNTLRLLQKVFRLRQCSDDFFANRSRPCLQYQIGRCSAPCVGLITPEEYHRDVELALQSIAGRNTNVAGQLQQAMDSSTARLDYETAAAFRDRLIALRSVQQQQSVSRRHGNLDIVVAALAHGGWCIQHMQVRQGKLVSNNSIFPSVSKQPSEAELVEAFVSHHYLRGSFRPDLPREIFINCQLEQRELIESVLAQQQGQKVRLVTNPRGERAEWLKLGRKNAEQTLLSRLANKRNHFSRLVELAGQLDMEQLPSRLECFDISHTFGEAPVASCVVFTQQGPLKSAYRLFNLSGLTPGDDYAAMRQALTRRFCKHEDIPQLLCIDGGKGQVMVALEVLDSLGIQLLVLGVAKGPARKPGLETLCIHRPGQPLEASALEIVRLRPESPALHIIQHIRDESHRFAITHHRKRRAKSRKSSKLEAIAGVGPAKRRELLRYFGSLEGVVDATERDLHKVPGISTRLAGEIYRQLRTS